MLAHPSFDKPPPRSLDRLDFTAASVEGLSPQDGAATLTAFTAASIARASAHFPKLPHTWIICGGESGANARQMDPAWAYELKAECEAASVPFFMKQMTGTRGWLAKVSEGHVVEKE